jgi:hypothetical protein
MSDTTITPAPEYTESLDYRPNESHLFNISLRGVIVLILLVTLCWLAVQEKIDPTNFMSYTFGVISAYFTQNIKPKSKTK